MTRYLVISMSLFWAQASQAATHQVRFCVEYSVDFVDALSTTGDDFYTDNTDKPARGTRLRVRANSTNVDVFYGYTEDDDPTEGCSPWLTLSDTDSYFVRAYSEAKIHGNFINVLNQDDIRIGHTEYSAFVPTSTQTITFDTGVHAMWNIAAAAGQAWYRHNGGVQNATVVLLEEGCNGPNDSGSCHGNGVAFIGSGGVDRKVEIAHETGHQQAWFKLVPTGKSNDPAAPQPSACTATLGHVMNSIEFQSEAIWEGWAHYFAALAFNDDTESDCFLEHYRVTDWEWDGFSDNNRLINCEGAYPGGDAKDYLGDWFTPSTGYCDATTLNNRGTTYDWLRHLWDLRTDEGVSFLTISDILDDANPHNWTADGDGAGSSACYPAVSSHAASRMRCAAWSNGFLSDWDNQDNGNGVHR